MSYDPLVVVERRERLEELCGEQEQRDYPFLFEQGLPRGHGLLPMSLEADWGCLIELGGPDHGRVINPPFNGNYFRTLAWRMSDAVACTRDLYEIGWYQSVDSDFDRRIASPGARPTSEGLAELDKVKPIIDEWNCNPVIAMFPDNYGYEPERPTNRPRT